MAVAIYTVNKHAKVASKDSMLYPLKQKILKELLKQRNAQKIGLHKSVFSNSQYRFSVAIKVSTYVFHLKPTPLDFKTLPYLGERNQQRNPKAHMSLKNAIYMLEEFLGIPHKRKNIQIFHTLCSREKKSKIIGISGGYLDK